MFYEHLHLNPLATQHLDNRVNRLYIFDSWANFKAKHFGGGIKTILCL